MVMSISALEIKCGGLRLMSPHAANRLDVDQEGTMQPTTLDATARKHGAAKGIDWCERTSDGSEDDVKISHAEGEVSIADAVGLLI